MAESLNLRFFMTNRKLITKWNLLALIALVLGGAATLGLDHWRLHSWADSGTAIPIGPRIAVELPAGQSHVYYESLVSVPAAGATLWLYDDEGIRVSVGKPEKDISYRLMLSGRSGRALWTLDLSKAGAYSVICSNHNFSHEREVPEGDRVVFAKQPDTLEEMSTARKIIQITGASITLTLVIVFYLLHATTLSNRESHAE